MWPFNRKKAQTPAMVGLTDEALTAQYRRVETLQSRELHWALRSRQGLVLMLGVSLACNAGLVVAIDGIYPTVRLVPLVVNTREDGTIRAEPVMSMMPIQFQEAAIRATLWQYVELREGYSHETAKLRHDEVISLSNREVGRSFNDWFNFSNPDGPTAKYGKQGVVQIDQDSADFVGDNIYQVNYWRTVRVPGQPESRSHWTVYVHFELVSVIPQRDRTTFNPDAIQVIGYPPPTEIDAPQPAKGPRA